MARPTVHVPMTSVAFKRGGLNRAARQIAGALAASGEMDVVIDVLGWQHDLERARLTLVEADALHPDVQVRHVFESLDPGEGDGATLAAVWEPPEGASLVATSERDSFWIRDGLPLARVRSWPDGTAKWIDVLDAHLDPAERHDVDSHGRLLRSTTFARDATTPRQQRWWGRDGRCFLTIRHDRPDPAEWGSAFFYDPEPRFLHDSREVYARAFIRGLAREEQPVLLAQFREGHATSPIDGYDPLFERLDHPGLRTVLVAHSNHHRKPFRRGAPVKAEWDRTLRSFDRWDAGVVLTEAQNADLEAEYGIGDRLTTIAHPRVRPDAAAPPPPTDPDKVVLVARITDYKRPEEAVQVIREVRRSRPTAQLHVYGLGYGDDVERSFRELLARDGNDDAVTWHGFTRSIDEVYADAAVTLSTSFTEGFALTVLESLSFGVPVVAWDVPYGPAEIIRDGIDGWLVADGDVAAMAARVVTLLDDAEARRRMSAAALERADAYSEDRHGEAWVRFVHDVVAAPSGRRLPARAEMLGVEVVDRQAGVLLHLPADRTTGSTLEVRVRGTERTATADVEQGRADVTLPETGPGDVLDFAVTTPGLDRVRVRTSRWARPTDTGHLEAYTTRSKAYALRHPAAAPAAGAQEERPALVRRLLGRRDPA